MITDSLKSAMKAALLAAAIITSASCSKSALDKMAGSYTYKTSGTVTLVPTEIAKLTPEQIAGYKAMGGTIDTLMLALTPEQGQMNITVTDNDRSRVIVSWNDILGNVSTACATVDGTRLDLEPSSKTPTLTDGSETIGGGIVAFIGTGELYSNMLMIEMDYSGTFTVQSGQTSISMTVIDSNVESVAKAN